MARSEQVLFQRRTDLSSVKGLKNTLKAKHRNIAVVDCLHSLADESQSAACLGLVDYVSFAQGSGAIVRVRRRRLRASCDLDRHYGCTSCVNQSVGRLWPRPASLAFRNTTAPAAANWKPSPRLLIKQVTSFS